LVEGYAPSLGNRQELRSLFAELLAIFVEAPAHFHDEGRGLLARNGQIPELLCEQSSSGLGAGVVVSSGDPIKQVARGLTRGKRIESDLPDVYRPVANSRRYQDMTSQARG
jgi:hypothetical protein